MSNYDQTGRTTAIIYRAIAEALTNKGEQICFQDHAPSPSKEVAIKVARRTEETTKEIINKSGLLGFKVKS